MFVIVVRKVFDPVVVVRLGDKNFIWLQLVRGLVDIMHRPPFDRNDDLPFNVLVQRVVLGIDQAGVDERLDREHDAVLWCRILFHGFIIKQGRGFVNMHGNKKTKHFKRINRARCKKTLGKTDILLKKKVLALIPL